MKYKETEPAKSFNGISVYLLRGALGSYYMKDWTKEQIKEYEDWVSINTQAFIFVKPNPICVAFLTKQMQNMRKQDALNLLCQCSLLEEY